MVRPPIGDHDGHSSRGSSVEKLSKSDWHSYASMGRRIAGQLPRVHRYSRPRQPLHEWHRCRIIEVGFMMYLFL